jgi:hypothetical protein
MRAAPGEIDRDADRVSVAELAGEVSQDLSTLMRQ